MPITRVFGKAKAQQGTGQETPLSPQTARISSGYVSRKIAEHAAKSPASEIDSERKHVLEGLAMLVSALNAQDGITAKAENIYTPEDYRQKLYFNLTIHHEGQPYPMGYLQLTRPAENRDAILVEIRNNAGRSVKPDIASEDGRIEFFNIVAERVEDIRLSNRIMRVNGMYVANRLEQLSIEAHRAAPSGRKP